LPSQFPPGRPDPEDADFYRNDALELHELKNRDFELSTQAFDSIQ
jgi:hypothetical protein